MSKQTGAAWRSESTIYQITRPERDIFLRSFFLELSDNISSHRKMMLFLIKVLSHDGEICNIFTFSQDFVFSLSSRAMQGFPDVPTRAPPSSFPSCFTNLFRKIFSWTEVRLPHPPRWSEVQRRPLASDPNGGSSPTTTQARRPILLVEMILKLEKQGFRSNAGRRDQKIFPKGGDPGYPRGREEKLLS